MQKKRSNISKNENKARIDKLAKEQCPFKLEFQSFQQLSNHDYNHWVFDPIRLRLFDHHSRNEKNYHNHIDQALAMFERIHTAT